MGLILQFLDLNHHRVNLVVGETNIVCVGGWLAEPGGRPKDDGIDWDRRREKDDNQ